MNTLTRHLLVAATAALAVAAALTLVAQDAVASSTGGASHVATPAGEALLLAAANVFCPDAAATADAS